MKFCFTTFLFVISLSIANAQWVQDGTSYTFNSTSETNTQSGSNLLNIYNTSTGVSSISATISSSNGTTALGTWSGSNSSIFSVFGYGGAAGSQSPFANGPNLTLSNSASATYSLSGSSYVGGIPANGQTGAPPIYSSGPGALISVISDGVSLNNYLTSTPPGYSGGNGGNVGISIAPPAGGTTLLQLGGPSSGAISSSNSGVPWEPSASVINAASYGGSAIAQWPARTGPNKAVWGNGGNGGNVNVDISSGTTLQIGSIQYPVNGQVAGISAISQGSPGAACCWSNGSNPPQTQYQILPNFTSGYTQGINLVGMGLNGNGGSVSVNNGATISAAQNILSTGQFGGNLYGIVAASIGGAATISPRYMDWVYPAPAGSPVGLGGTVSVTNNAGINLPGQNSIGIMAVSASNQTILPPSVTVTGSGNTAAPVSVFLDQNSSITTGNNSTGTSTVGLGNISGGVFAISSTGWLVSPFNRAANSSVSAGNGGPVTVNNLGSINSYGHIGLGIAALSIGNTGFMSNYLMSTSPLANNVTYVGSGVSSNGFDSSAGSSTVTNSGTISTLGSSAPGILAASNGSGGFLGNDTSPVTYGPFTQRSDGIQIATGFSAGSYLGGNSGNYVASGGTVNVTNSGQIYTGSPNSTSGVGSVGIVAQSVGGGGGTVGGRGAAIQVGDSDGNGGVGGPVTVNNVGGSIVTYNDGSHAVLAQSVGGGGGNAANSSGIFTAVGGAGGGGGNGGSVSITTGGGPGGVSTSGDFSTAFVGQSIGGGGGNGGYSKSYGVFVSTAIGGIGGSGGSGGTVNFNNQGYTNGNQINQITTSGDQSHGVLLQSIGGGGGVGGGASSYAAGVIFGSGVAVGGAGGSGGGGGSIGTSSNPIQNSGQVTTSGNDSIGFLMQSIGGGGGNAGSAMAKTLAASFPANPEIPTLAFSSAVGGAGGSGGGGGNIFFNNSGSLITSGSNALAVAAQSIGGGGGNGGDSTAGANLYGNSRYTLNSSISVGGSGGVAGSGGQINITNAGSIQAYGNNSIAFLGQSIGGGGGTSGSGNATETKVTTGEKALNLVLGIGGKAGAAGAGGDITLSNSNLIQTLGSSSSGVIAQSIGGGGGIGGNAGTQGISNGLTANIAIGGSGGAGGNAGLVTITNTGNISTGGLLSNGSNNPMAIGGDSHAIVAQSIAGGGGIAGSSDPAANLISNPFAATTKGLEAYATYHGIYEFIKSPSLSTFPKNYEVTVGVGGNGGSAGAANAVDINNSGSINTIGHRSFGIMGQSIGGGGGYGASVMSGSSAVGSSVSGGLGIGAFKGLVFNTAVNVGGVGGASSDGNNVNISQNGSITTAGYGSHAVLAQSIGGGGGYGADGSIAANTGFTGDATWNDGANGGFRIALGSTGTSPSTGNGGVVTYNGTSSANITTYGDNSVGILAQAIGGGGGVASGGCTNNGQTSGASACLASTLTAGNATTPASFINQGQMMALVINPSSNTSSQSSNGGGVQINSLDTINVYGSGSIGVAAQSIGGGGGLILGNSANIASATLPAMGTSVGMGGSVNVNVNQITLQSSATGSIGVLAQSIGGGGGFLGDPNMPISGSLPSNSGTLNAGSGISTRGGSVNVNVNGNIVMYGANQIGVVAQSIGGGGGFSSVNGNIVTQNTSLSQGSQGGAGGSVNVNVNYTILDLGNQGNTIGVFAQSQGNSELSNASSISVNVTTNNSHGILIPSTIQAGTGIVISGGSNGSNGTSNTVNVGLGSSIIVPNGNNAILSTYGTTNVTNNGYISGGILVGPTPGYSAAGGSINNYGTINAAAPTITTSNNSLNNYGRLYVAGEGIVGRTDVYGSFKQFLTGQTYFDIDSVLHANDYLTMIANGTSAGTMFQNGSFGINRINPRLLPVKSDTYQILTAQGGFLSSANGISAAPISVFDNSPVVNWGLQQSGNDLSISYQGLTANPSGISLNKNQQNLLNYLVRAYDNNDPGANAAISKLVSNSFASIGPGTRTSNLATLLDGINGEGQTIQQQTIVMTGNGMLGSALSCPTFEGNSTEYGETECVWTKFNGGQMRQSASDINPGYSVTENTLSAGVQKKIADDTFVGAAFRYGQTNSSSTNFRANATVGDISLGLKKIVNNYYFGFAGAFGISSQSNNRSVYDSFLGQGFNLTSNNNIYYGGVRVRNAYTFDLPNGTYVKPYVDLDGLWTYTPSYQESGPLAAIPLQYNAQNGSNFIASPMIEFGGRLNMSGIGNMWIRPYFSAGAMFITNNSSNLNAAIVGTNSGTFNISTQSPNSLFKANAGVQIFSGDAIDVRLEYSALAGQGFVGQSGSARANFRF